MGTTGSMLQDMRSQMNDLSPQDMNKRQILDEISDWDEGEIIREMMDQLDLNDNYSTDRRRLMEVFAKLCKIRVNNNMYRKALDERSLLVVDGELNAKRIKRGQDTGRDQQKKQRIG